MPRSIAMMTSQVEISANASIRVFSMRHHGIGMQADRKRHAQHLRENQMDADRRQDRRAAATASSRAPSAVDVTSTISPAVRMKPSLSAATT